MNENMIIVIGREYGSGGKAIGQIVADKLGIKLYDKELIEVAAEESGLSKEFIESNDEKPITSFFYSLSATAQSAFGNFSDTPINQKAFMAQFEAIKKLAEKESCVIVGRCADYALSEHSNLTSVFICADMDAKISLVSRLRGVSKDKAIELINKTNKKRANYYNYYSFMTWGAPATYDLCINSSRTGYEAAADTIIKFAQTKEELLKKEAEEAEEQD